MTHEKAPSFQDTCMIVTQLSTFIPLTNGDPSGITFLLTSMETTQLFSKQIWLLQYYVCIYFDLFNDAVSSLEYKASNNKIN
jgi:hypothetical protein